MGVRCVISNGITRTREVSGATGGTVSTKPILLAFNEVDSAPAEPGVYAWYYRQVITAFDLNSLLSSLAESDERQKHELVRAFLERHVFRAFESPSYHAEIRAPLAPSYAGELTHRTEITKELIDRICKSPERLRVIKEVLEAAVPEFATPIYIGMSKDLRARLRAHKRLIDAHKKVEGRVGASMISLPPDAKPEDRSFASEVVRRKLGLNGLVVAVRPIKSSDKEHVDVENVLNRINYPICGRN